MKRIVFPIAMVLLFVTSAWVYKSNESAKAERPGITREKASLEHSINSDTVHFPGETHFANIQQLTFGGDNAEAYFSFDGKYLVYQKSNIKKELPAIRSGWEKYPPMPEKNLNQNW